LHTEDFAVKRNGWFMRLICLFAAALFMLLGGCTVPTIELCTGGASSPGECFAEFMQYMNLGEFEAADGCLYNYETLGFGAPGGDAMYSGMYSQLQLSRSGKVLSTLSQDGDSALLEVELTTLDFRKVETALSELTSQKAQEMKMDGIEITDDAQIKQIMSECFNQLMQTPQELYTTDTFQLELVRKDGRWLIVCTEEFYSALIGYAM